MRLHWRSHNIQKFEALPHAETRNLMDGYDGMRDESAQTDDELRRPGCGPRDGSAPTMTDEADDPSDAATATRRRPNARPLLVAPAGADATMLTPAELDRRFDAWASGKTGYPLVDACMRCLDTTGWLTFRMRCLCVSFACYHLWLHWRRPAIWLARRFVDFEPGIHFCQMQMQAGCAEFVEMRVYNPIKQASEQDPDGVFIRRWLPELARVPVSYLHEPSRMPKVAQREAGIVLGVQYPRPIVDHQQAYDRAKRVLQERRNAMGWGGGGGSGAHRREAAAARGAGGGGSLDLRVMLGAKRLREETVASSNGRAADPLRQDDEESSRFGGEARTREQLMAAGFPPELARRAASAYPDHAERAADWIISTNDW